MKANIALRCDLRGSLPLYAITPFVLTGIVLPMVFSAVMDARAGLPRGEWSLTDAGEVFAAVLFAVDVLLLAWVLAFPLREWLALGRSGSFPAPLVGGLQPERTTPKG